MRRRSKGTRRGGLATAHISLLMNGLLLLFVPACSERPDAAGGTDVEMSSSSSPELVLELRIGRLDGPEDQVFGDIVGLAVGSEGDIFVFDRQVPALRHYRPDGTFVRTMGRSGSGPGEYQTSDGGLAVLTDGRVVLRDPGNGRILAYTQEGAPVATWPLRTSVFSGTPLFSQPQGGFFNHIPSGQLPAGFDRSGVYLARHDAEGVPRDTLRLPVPEVAVQMIAVTGPAMGVRRAAPFSPLAFWTVTADGDVVAGRSDRYEITRHRSDGSIGQLMREVAPVPISADEREAVQDEFVMAMRRVDPAWRGEELPIPSSKPYFRGLYAGERDRIWVLVHQPAERVATAPPVGGELGARPTLDEVLSLRAADPVGYQFREPVLFDVFGPDDSYLGSVRAPQGFATVPQPVFGAEHVWAVVRDEFDVQYVARFRVVPGLP